LPEFLTEDNTLDSIDNSTAYEISREFPATQETLFRSFIDEATLKSIWGVSSITVEAKPGSNARAILQIDNENWNFTITYQEVVPSDKLRWVVHFDRFPSKEIRVTLWFQPATNGARVTVRMENFESSEERDANKQAWEGALRTLEGLILK